MKNSGIYFTFTGCYGNQNGRLNRLNIEKLPFQAKFEAFGDRFFKNKISAQANTKKTFKYIVRHDNSHHLFKFFFGICLCSALIPLFHVSTLLQNGHFPILAAIFVTIATLKVESMPDFYTLAIVLIN